MRGTAGLNLVGDVRGTAGLNLVGELRRTAGLNLVGEHSLTIKRLSLKQSFSQLATIKAVIKAIHPPAN